MSTLHLLCTPTPRLFYCAESVHRPDPSEYLRVTGFSLMQMEQLMIEILQEYVDSRGVALRVDQAGGVLRGVKLIGIESLNGRRYRPAALSAAIGLYEGAKVNVNHPKEGPLAPRDYRDRLGVIRQVEFRPDEGLFGNLHFNPKHALAEQLAWDAEHNPRNVGFSHNVLARLSREGEQTIVEAITHVQSVDLVADPAATQGLFEQAEADRANLEVAESQRVALDEATAEVERLNAQLQASAQREAELQERLNVFEAQRGRPKSSEPLARLIERREPVATSADFARSIKSRP